MGVPEPIPAVQEATVIFVINKAWSPGSDTQATYDATRKYWKVGARTRDRAAYALGVSGGIVRGAYRIQEWHQSEDKSRRGAVRIYFFNTAARGSSIAERMRLTSQNRAPVQVKQTSPEMYLRKPHCKLC